MTARRLNHDRSLPEWLQFEKQRPKLNYPRPRRVSSCGQNVRCSAETYSLVQTGINFCLLLVLRMDSGYHQSRVVLHTCMVRGGVVWGGGRGETKELGSQVFFFF